MPYCRALSLSAPREVMPDGGSAGWRGEMGGVFSGYTDLGSPTHD